MKKENYWTVIFLAILITGTSQKICGQDSFDDQVTTIIDSLPQSVGGITIDNLGYIYSADFDETIWKINPYTKKATVFAKGFYLASGNAFDNKGRLYQANLAGNYISRVDRSGKAEIFADSLFSSPIGMAINAKNELFVCNCANRTITKVDSEGKTEIFAKSGLFLCPNGIALDGLGNIYVVNYNNNNVVKITPDGEVSLFAQTPDKIGNGHIVVANNKIYVTGFHGHRIYQIEMSGKVSVLAGTGKRGSLDGSALEATFSYPNGITYNSGDQILYINERHKDQGLPAIYPAKFSIRAIKLTRISDLIKKEIDSNGFDNVMSLYRNLKRIRSLKMKIQNQP